MCGSLTVGAALLYLPAARADPTDEDLIKTAIEGGIRVMAEACIDDSHGYEAAYKSTAEVYWSASTPEATELAERETRFRALFATPNPTAVAADAATLAVNAPTDPTVYPSFKLTAIAEYVVPTPNWDPEHSALQDRQQEIDICQQSYGLPGFLATDTDVTSFSYQSIVVDGDEAKVDVTISMWSDYDVGGTVERTYGAVPFALWLRKEQGVWKISRQFYEMQP